MWVLFHWILWLLAGVVIGGALRALVPALVRRLRNRQSELAMLRGFAEGETEAMLELWLTRAAEVARSETLNRHILKHVGELFVEVQTHSDREAWSASMHNLLTIYDRFHGVEASAQRQIARMMIKFYAEPEAHTRPPEVNELVAQIDKVQAERKAKKDEEERRRAEQRRYEGT